MEEKQKYNKEISKYFFQLYIENKRDKKKYLGLAGNVRDCLKFWWWNAYHNNKVLDLQKNSQCHSRFCSNCRKLDLARAMNNFKPHFQNLILQDYVPCLLTITVPNCSGSDLKFTLDKMQRAFNRFYKWYSLDNKNGYKDRFLRFYAAIKCIEVNYSKRRGDYHAHYHGLVFIRYADYNIDLFNKYIVGEWSNRRQSYNMYSDFDEQIRKLWTIAYNGLKVKEYSNLKMLEDTYLCDIREADSDSIYEVMKYVFKDTDICNYYVFKDMYFGLFGKRIRQGYGLLYDVKLENDSDGEMQSLEFYLTEKESPETLVTNELKTLYNDYAHYIKISRFNKYDELKNLGD